MGRVGKAFVFDYDGLAVRVKYLSATRLAWEQVQGPSPGLKAEEDYGSAPIRRNVDFLWWQEKDSSVVAQVVDFERGVVHTTWSSPEKKVSAFQGKVKPAAG